MKIVIQDTCLKWMLNILKKAAQSSKPSTIFTRKNEYQKNVKSLFVVFMIKKNNVAQIRISKQALDHGLIIKKLHKVVQFN